MMNRLSYLSFLVVVTTSTAFYVSQNKVPMTTSHNVASSPRMGGDDSEMQFPPMDPFQMVDVDIEKAKDCAEHFGKCSLKEVKQLKDDLHRERIQSIMLGTATSEELFEHRLMEEELSLQLNLLNEEMPSSTLFPEVEESMVELPHLKDGTVSKHAVDTLEKGNELFVLEELIEEGVVESMVICMLIGAVLMAPQVVLGM